jgi:hypothetical protein
MIEDKYICQYLKDCKNNNLDSDCIWEEYDTMVKSNVKLSLENDENIKYKTMWEELYSEREKPCSIEYMQDLEEKYKIGVE